MKKALKDYYIACNNVVSEFVGKYFGCEYILWQSNNKDCEDGYEFTAGDGYDDGETCYGEWVEKEVGGVIQIGDYFFGMNRIVEALELGASEDQLFDYYDLEIDRDGKVGYSFKNFVKYGKKQMEKVINEILGNNDKR